MWFALLLVPLLAASACAHGRVLQPPSRASAWRFGYLVPANYDDDGLNCGGYSGQHSTNGGKCGICGDPYNLTPPRPHELGGTYGVGVITGRYQPGGVITTTVDLTTSHKGYWEFKLCPDPESNDQACFDRYVLEHENGGTRYYPDRGSTKYNVTYKLPEKLVCEHCVLQWRYTAGNNWGSCGNGTSGLGCGPQEQFGACSDISIGNLKSLLRGGENDVAPLVYYLKNGYFDVQQGVLHLLRGKERPEEPETKLPQPNQINNNQNPPYTPTGPSNQRPIQNKPPIGPSNRLPTQNHPTGQSNRQPPQNYPTGQSNRQPPQNYPTGQSNRQPPQNYPTGQSNRQPPQNYPTGQSNRQPPQNYPTGQSNRQPPQNYPTGQSNLRPAQNNVPTAPNQHPVQNTPPTGQSGTRPVQNNFPTGPNHRPEVKSNPNGQPKRPVLNSNLLGQNKGPIENYQPTGPSNQQKPKQHKQNASNSNSIQSQKKQPNKQSNQIHNIKTVQEPYRTVEQIVVRTNIKGDPERIKQIQQLQQLQHIQQLINSNQQNIRPNQQRPSSPQNEKLIQQTEIQHYYNKKNQNQYYQNTVKHRKRQPRGRNKQWKIVRHGVPHKKRKRKKGKHRKKNKVAYYEYY